MPETSIKWETLKAFFYEVEVRGSGGAARPPAREDGAACRPPEARSAAGPKPDLGHPAAEFTMRFIV